MCNSKMLFLLSMTFGGIIEAKMGACRLGVKNMDVVE